MLKRRLVAMLAAALVAAAAVADEADPLPVPKAGPQLQSVTAYNEGVKLLLEKRYPEAQQRFEAALAADEAFAQAHNNLAFSLRMQGAHNNEKALRHYARALQIDPKLALAYAYRGALFTQLGDMTRARADLEVLKVLDTKLAAKLERTIDERADRKDRDGIASQVDIY